MNFLDKTIGFFSPRWALKRSRTRNSLRKYEGASNSRRTTHWRHGTTSANTEIDTSVVTLRSRARKMTRDTAWGKNIKRKLGVKIIGTGIIPQAKGKTRAGKKLDELWVVWGDTTQCDYDERKSFYALQSLCVRTVVESGSCLIRRHRQTYDSVLAVPLQLQLLEPDFLDRSQDMRKLENGNIVRQGIEIDSNGKRVAYWLFSEHPGERLTVSGYKSERIPASEILHIFDEDRPGVLTDVPWLHAVLTRLKDFDELKDSQLVKHKVAACFAAFLYDIEPIDDEPPEDFVETLEPGRIEICPPGKRIETADPPKAENYNDLDKAFLHEIAAGVGLSYETLTGDWSQVNFTSGRMGQLIEQGFVEHCQWNMIIPQFCEAVWRWFEAAAIISGQVRHRTGASWTPQPPSYVQPKDEINALKNEVRSGFKTQSEAIRERGFDPDTFFEEYKNDLNKIDALGLVFDTDPRKIGNAGTAQKEKIEKEEED